MKPEIALSRGSTIAATGLLIVLLGLPLAPHATDAQRQDAPAGEWRYIGGDVAHTRYSPLDQIDATNFSKARGGLDLARRQLRPSRRLPLPVNAALRGRPALHRRRRAPHGRRHRSRPPARPSGPTASLTRRASRAGMRNNYGKGVAYAEVDGRKVIFYTSPAFFLHALDAKTGAAPGELGHAVPLPGFPTLGVVDMLPTWSRTGSRGSRPATSTIPITASLGISATSPPRRRPSSSTAWSWSATCTSRATTRRASRTSPATSSPTTRRPASRCGSSTSSRGPASSDTTPGRTTPGSAPATCRRGRRCRPIPSAGSSTSRPTRRPSTSSAASAPATTCSGPASSRST